MRSGRQTVGTKEYVQKPPTPMEIVPAMSSATPPSTTSFEFPKLDSPAVRAKGTVKPSDRPMILEIGLSHQKRKKNAQRKKSLTHRAPRRDSTAVSLPFL